MEEFLRNADKEQLDPDAIKGDLEKLFEDPQAGVEALQQRLSTVDRDTIETLVAMRQDMTREEVHQYVDRVWQVVESMTGKAAAETEKIKGKPMAEVEAQTVEAQTKVASSTRERVLDRIEEYIASLDRPTLDAEAIRNDLELMFSDPQFAAEDLYHRAKNLNREDVMAIVTANRYISREDADKLVNRIMDLRDEAVLRAETMKKEIDYRIDQAREEAMHQADEMRKTAASATWWMFIAATVSGVTAVLGGVVATIA